MNKEKQKKPRDPALYEESYLQEGGDETARPPYIFLALILFVILSFIWKGFMSERKEGAKENAPPAISQSDEAKPEDIMR